MPSFKRLSARLHIAAAAGATLLAAGIAAAPAAWAATAQSPTVPWVQIAVPFEGQGASAATVCASNIPAHADQNHEALTFWYLKNGCIGTIKTTTYAAAHKCANPQLRIYSGGVKFKFYLVNPNGTKHIVCKKFAYYWNPWPNGPSHHQYTNPIQVVASAERTQGQGEYGPAKVTVNG